MKTLQISDKLARKIYLKADSEFKDLLEENFGVPFFNEKITDRVKTFEDAYNVLGINTGCVYSSSEEPDEIAYKKLKVIVKALNEGWTPDWNDDDQYKWYPWFELQKTNSNPSGFRLDCVNYHYAGSAVGSRLCFRSRELAEYAAKQFEDLYKQFFTL
jgi:hypothetical protein